MPAAAPARLATDAWIAAGLGLVLLSFVAPIGVASGEAVDLTAAALGARRPFAASFPLADLLTRLVVWFPAGELGVRPHLLAALAGVVVLALRAVPAGEDTHPPAGRLGAVALLALSRPFLEVATRRPTTAVEAALLVVGLHLMGAVRASAGAGRAGLGLAFVCGLAAGAAWPLRAVLWPVGALLALRSLRRGHRWPVLAPALFGAGLLPFAGAVVAAAAPAPTVREILARLFLSPGHSSATAAAFWSAARVIGEDLGVLALLVVGLGAWTLVRRAAAGWRLAAASWLAIAGAAAATGDLALARVTAVTAVGAPFAAGVGALAAVFGRARHAAGVVIVVVAVVPAAWLGMEAALAVPSRRAPAALARELEAAVVASPDPAQPAGARALAAEAAARWRRYQTAVAGAR
jgi:hypothetical protein